MNLEKSTRQNQYLILWLPLVATIMMGFTALILFFLNRATDIPAFWGASGGSRNQLPLWVGLIQQAIFLPIVAGSFGLLIVRQRPRQRIGWLLVVLGIFSALVILAQELAIYGYHTLAGAGWGWSIAGWLTNWSWIILFFLLLLLVSVFPDGRFVSHRWRTIILILLTLFVGPLLIATVLETPMTSAAQIPNPFVQTHPEKLYDALFSLGVPFMPITAVAVLAAVLVRFRRSRGRERQQMKWLLAGVALLAGMVVVGLILSFSGIVAGDLIVNFSPLVPLIGIGVALVRHQLYDIDVIIRRTLLYTAVSLILALVYFGSVILFQQLFTRVMGQQSPVAIVISTLLIAALFNPLRGRLQDFLDLRFYRQKYNAEQVLARFAQTARDEVEVETLQTDLLHIVQETIQPEHVSIWLK